MTNAGDDHREYDAVRARIENQLADAIRASQEVTADEGRRGAGTSADGVARVTIDHQGFLADVQFTRAVAELEPQELRGRFLEALRAARTDLSGSAPAVAGADLTDTSIIDTLDALLRGESPGGHDG